MFKDFSSIPAEFTVVESECGSWLLIVKPSEVINYDEFLDAIRSYLTEQTGMDDLGPSDKDPVN